MGLDSLLGGRPYKGLKKSIHNSYRYLKITEHCEVVMETIILGSADNNVYFTKSSKEI